MSNTDDSSSTSLPDFILGGAMKCATSSLHHLLRQHDEVYLPDCETHFFCVDDPVQHADFFFPPRSSSERAPDYDRDFRQNLDWYRAFFEAARPGQHVGDYSTTYLPAPDAPRRIHALRPDAKLIFMLRDPVDRTYSHYWHRVKTGRAVHSFEHELQNGPNTLLLRSFYEPQLKRYLRHFSRDQLKIVFFETFVADTQTVVDEVCSFLGLSSSLDVAEADAHQNRSPVPRWPALQRLFNYCSTGIEGRGDTALPYPQKPQSSYFLQGVVYHLRELNLTTRRSPPPMSEAARNCLAQICARKNRGLGELLDGNPAEHWPCLRGAPSR